jgi:predicted DNA-binding helix-hairpin-helix protein
MRSLDLEAKLRILGASAVDDPEPGGGPPRAAPIADAVGDGRRAPAAQPPEGRPLFGQPVRMPSVTRPTAVPGVVAVRTPGGSIPMMRVMVTNACSLGCRYCATRCGRRLRRTLVSPEDLARSFLDLHRRGLARALFLTSGIPGRAVAAQDRLLAAAEILRERHGYRGYLHLKLMPGAEPAQIERAVALASRVSINLEAPTRDALGHLAPDKRLDQDLLPVLVTAGRLARDARRMRAEAMRGASAEALARMHDPEGRAPGGAPAGVTTQFVVGAAGERDRDTLGLVARLERQRLLHHAHFSPFVPVRDTPMEGDAPAPEARALRLYQADYLMRDYGFGFDELPFDGVGNLPLDADPKLAWAFAHPERFPLALERASREELLRVPGIGPTTADRLLAARGAVVLRGLDDLAHAGVQARRAAPFLTLGGRLLGRRDSSVQLALFRDGRPAVTYPIDTDTSPCAYR